MCDEVFIRIRLVFIKKVTGPMVMVEVRLSGSSEMLRVVVMFPLIDILI